MISQLKIMDKKIRPVSNLPFSKDQRYLRSNNRTDDKSKIEKELKVLKLEVSKIQNEKEEIQKLNDGLKKEVQLLQTENVEIKQLTKSLEKDLANVTSKNETLKIEKEMLEALLHKECRSRMYVGIIIGH